MTVDEFKAALRDELNIGSDYDAAIDRVLPRAVRWVERAIDLPYMRAVISLSLTGSTWAVPSDLKKVLFFTYWSGSLLVVVPKMDIRDLRAQSTEISAFWLRDGSTVEFDTSGDGLAMDAHVLQFTSALGTTHWLLDNAEDLMIAQCAIMLSPAIRDADAFALYRPLRDEALRSLAAAAEEWEHAGDYAVMEPRA